MLRTTVLLSLTEEGTRCEARQTGYVCQITNTIHNSRLTKRARSNGASFVSVAKKKKSILVSEKLDASAVLSLMQRFLYSKLKLFAVKKQAISVAVRRLIEYTSEHICVP